MGKNIIVKLDIEAVYPSITYTLAAEAVCYFTRELSEEDKMRVKADLEMRKFSMSNCLINVGEDYFQYAKEMDPLKRFYKSADTT